MIFAKKLEQFGDRIAVITQDDKFVSYIQLANLADEFSKKFPTDGQQLLMLAANTSLNSIVAYIAALRAGVPVILSPYDKVDTIENINKVFKPTIIYKPQENSLEINHKADNLEIKQKFPNELAVMLSTSGSTGSAKLVKLSDININANANSISEYLLLDSTERAITSLPIYYSYGLSIINSHLSVGASIVLTGSSVVDDDFWDLFIKHNCTSLAGVPYTYELLNRIGFENFELPNLRYLTQAGGKLAKELVEYFALLAKTNGWRFYVMYGQTEATARMSYLPPDKIFTHLGSVGIPIPGGTFDLIDEKGRSIKTPNKNGELVYRGPNVMMGYATERSSLFDTSKLSELKTGDIAKKDKDGLYYIAGRKSRFLKLFGNRIGLDDLESALRGVGYVTICGGSDKHLVVLTIDQDKVHEIEKLIESKYSIPRDHFSVEGCKHFPLLPSGKIDYQKLLQISNEKMIAKENLEQSDLKWSSSKNKEITAEEIFSKVFNDKALTEESTFKSLGGDSLNYINMTILLEKKLGNLPEKWPEMTIREINNIPKLSNVSRFTKIETNIALRFLAITGVVANHCYLINEPYNDGASGLLFILVGYSFARFQLERVLNGDVWKTMSGYLNKIVVPYMITCVGFILYYLFFKKESPDYDLLLMVTNFYRLQENTATYLWFLQVLAQCFVIFGLIFSFKTIENYAKNNIWKFSIILLGFFSIVYFAMESFWNTNALLNRVPQIYLPIILIGWCAYLAKDRINKLTLFSYSVLFFSVMAANIWTLSQYLWLTVGASALILIPNISVPNVVKPIVAIIGANALSIYLIHMIVLHILEKVINKPLVLFALVVFCCFVIILTYDKTKKYINLYLNKSHELKVWRNK
jgi:acyl-CoA synthetase (AMP-forming)/AMP-acid ligase II/acyl carrier protein